MISGGVKFFHRSKCLAQDGATVIASSGNASAARALDRNTFTYWRTSGSTDASTETFELSFTEPMAIDRIILADHNFKSFSIQYDVSGVWTDFTSVVGIDGSTGNILETAFTNDTAYYEFDEVTTGKLLLSVTEAQVVDAQKYLNQFIVTTEIGTLQGYPVIKNTELSRNLRSQKMLSGRTLTMKSDEYFKVDLEFKNYPASLSDDIDLIFSLHDMEDNFLVWLCGGRYGSTYFKKQLRGHRLRDIFPMQLDSVIKPIYSDSVYVNTVNFMASLSEDVQ